MESYYENYFSYDSSADYHISVYPQLDTKHNFPVGDGYDDYYNYVVWAQADPVYQPYYWNFFGPGPETEIDLSSIVLGGVFAYFTQGAQSGPPHHLRVNSDSDFTLSPSTNPPGCLCAQHSGRCWAIACEALSRHRASAMRGLYSRRFERHARFG
jgi:hypothetical protein